MCNYKEAVNTVLAVLDKDFEFSPEDRAQALLLALQILGDEEMLEELKGN